MLRGAPAMSTATKPTTGTGTGAGGLLIAAVVVLLLPAIVVLAMIAALIGGTQQACDNATDPADPVSGPVGALGGIGGTGISRSELGAVRARHQGTVFAAGRFSTTAYGPPWGVDPGAGVDQGAGAATAGGIRLNGGAPRKYMVAVDPARISLGQWVYAQPNPFAWDGAFLAADTGGAIDGMELDFYDWRGRAYQNRWGRRDVQVIRAPSSPFGSGPADVQPGDDTLPIVAPPGSARPAPTSGPVLNLGDSLGVGTATGLSQQLSGRTVTTLARMNRTSSQGLEVLRDVRDVPATLVVQLGTNDGDADVFRRNVRSLLAIARRADATVYWVNVARPPLPGRPANDTDLNLVLDSEARRHPNLVVIDWKAAVADGRVRLSDDVHPSPAGYETRVELITAALAGGPGATAAAGCEAGASTAPLTPGERALILPSGEAAAPEQAPDAVKRMIAAGNRINQFAYSYGGAHGAPAETMNQARPNPGAVPGRLENGGAGYDCSSAVSYLLWGGGLQSLLGGRVLDSTGLESVGEPGSGRWVTIYANASHAYIEVAGIFFDTAGGKGNPPTPPSTGPRWTPNRYANGEGFVTRHPEGL